MSVEEEGDIEIEVEEGGGDGAPMTTESLVCSRPTIDHPSACSARSRVSSEAGGVDTMSMCSSLLRLTFLKELFWRIEREGMCKL